MISTLSEPITKNFTIILFCLTVGLFTPRVDSQQKENREEKSLKVFSTDAQILLTNKEKILNGDTYLEKPLKKLYASAAKALKQPPLSVTDKTALPPSGDKHDYMSIASYWWPDNSKPDGLPYIRRDGEVNAEVENIPDKKSFSRLTNSVYVLALAYFFSGDEKFAQHAVELLNVWFIDDATKMNPNFNFAQAVPGRNTGRGAGLIEARNFIQIIDAVGLLENSRSLSPIVTVKLRDWFTNYRKWTKESKLALHEENAKNNHGSWFAAQTSAIDLFLGDTASVKNTLQKILSERIGAQVQPDGKQPEELIRTKSLHYSAFNLEALFILGIMGNRVGIDLWNYATPDGRSLQKAFDFILPSMLNEKKWEFKQISSFEEERVYPMILSASKYFKENKYETPAEEMSKEYRNELSTLLFNNRDNN